MKIMLTIMLLVMVLIHSCVKKRSPSTDASDGVKLHTVDYIKYGHPKFSSKPVHGREVCS